MKLDQIKTLGALKQSDYKLKTIKQEMRSNLLRFLKEKHNPFEGIQRVFEYLENC